MLVGSGGKGIVTFQQFKQSVQQGIHSWGRTPIINVPCETRWTIPAIARQTCPSALSSSIVFHETKRLNHSSNANNYETPRKSTGSQTKTNLKNIPTNGSKRSTRSPTIVVTLESLHSSVDDVLSRLLELDLNPIRNNENHANIRRLCLEDLESIMGSLLQAVHDGQLDPSGKYGKDMSELIEKMLLSFRELSQMSPPPSDQLSIYDSYCVQALDLLNKWNLNIGSKHYEHAIAVAVQEELWEKASKLFWTQIDPGAAYTPVSISLSDPKGLYAIARLAQQQKSAVAELVFDAVQQLCMVSPRDQEMYVLAAGTALGQAGEWESAVEYLNSSYLASRWGQPLVASVMHACLLSGRPEEAIHVYHAKQKGNANGKVDNSEEWQWGGERDVGDPLIRDLAMRACGAKPGLSAWALDNFHESMHQGVTISLEALQGVVRACEHDADLDGLLKVLDIILQNGGKTNWIVPGSSLVIDDCENKTLAPLGHGAVTSRWIPEMKDLIASMMRTCNAQSSFGTSLFYLRQFQLQLADHDTDQQRLRTSAKSGDGNKMVDWMLPFFTSVSEGHQLVGLTMVSLCGLRCYNEAIRCYDMYTSVNAHDAEIHSARVIAEYATAEMDKHGVVRIGNPWASANRHILRLTSALHQIERGNHRGSEQDYGLILKGLAACMKSCTNAHQPDLSLRALVYTDHCLQLQQPKHIPSDGFTLDRAVEMALQDDTLASEIIHAYRWRKDMTSAKEVFQRVLSEKVSELDKWRQTCATGLSILISSGHGAEAVEMFRAMPESARSSDAYVSIGRYFSRTDETDQLHNLYRQALQDGCLSEELSLMIMLSVSKSKMDNRLRVLRTMVVDNAKLAGMDRSKWMRTRYWNIKRVLGFYYARLLMWWNDPESSFLDELELSITEFYERKQLGLKAKNDVIRSILANIKSFEPLPSQADSSRWSHVPASSEGWSQLLSDVIDESRYTTLLYDATVIDDMVDAFMKLNENRQCLSFVDDLLSRDIMVNESTLRKALDAAETIQSLDHTKIILADSETRSTL